MVGGTSSSGTCRTVGVCGAYWISSNTSVRNTTAPGVAPRLSPTAKSEPSTICGMRGALAMSRSRFSPPRRKFIPPLSIAALNEAGFNTGTLLGDHLAQPVGGAARPADQPAGELDGGHVRGQPPYRPEGGVDQQGIQGYGQVVDLRRGHGPSSTGGRISRLSTLPVGPLGSASSSQTLRGYLYAATWPLM